MNTTNSFEEVVFKVEKKYKDQRYANVADHAHQDVLQDNPIDIEEIKIENNLNNPRISEDVTDLPEIIIKEVKDIKPEISCTTVNRFNDKKTTNAINIRRTRKLLYKKNKDPLSITDVTHKNEIEAIHQESSEQTSETPTEHGFKYVDILDIKRDLKTSSDVSTRNNVNSNLEHDNCTSVDPNNYTVLEIGREKYYNCNICSVKYRYKSEMKRHMLQHTGDRPFACHLCPARYTHRGNLNGHMRIHTGEKPYTCDICSKNFREKSNLRRHMRIHTGDKPYKCEVCFASFRDHSILDRHMLIHTGSGAYTCCICFANLRQRGALKKHMRTHTKDQKYVCNVCYANFDLKRQLDSHILTHPGKKRYTCRICSNKYVNKKSLKNHMRIHTGEKPFGCGICSVNFRTNSQLNKHLLIHNLNK